jgi:hypothetical protein
MDFQMGHVFPVQGDNVLLESEGDWASDLSLHIGDALTKLSEYLGVEFADGRLDEIAYEASRLAADQMVAEVRAGKTRDVLAVGDRPAFCFWTPQRALQVEDEAPEQERR